MVALRGRFSVASSNELVRVIGADIQDHEVVIFDFSNTTHVDDSAALVVEQLIDTAADENTECIVMSLSGSVAGTLNALNVFKNLPKDRFVNNMDEAREIAKNLLTNGTG